LTVNPTLVRVRTPADCTMRFPFKRTEVSDIVVVSLTIQSPLGGGGVARPPVPDRPGIGNASMMATAASKTGRTSTRIIPMFDIAR